MDANVMTEHLFAKHY